MAFCVTVRRGDSVHKIKYDSPVSASEVIRDAGLSFDRPCGGRGVCGNCRVIATGVLSEPNEAEREFLGSELDDNVRLGCMVMINDDAEITLADECIESKLEFTEENEVYGCAIDIGTTTIETRIIAKSDRRVVFSDRRANPQRIHGGDTLTRMDFSLKGGREELRELIEKELRDIVVRFPHEIDEYVITGNTAMLHILCGDEVEGIAVAPFRPKRLFGEWINNRYIMRCASAYIGGDAVASLIATGLDKSERNGMILDIGTNNECILKYGDRLLACSSPAGPAFEGGNISCGICARGNAIKQVIDGDGEPIVVTVEPNAEPKGFCGSGLIDAVAYLRRNGYIAEDGSVIQGLPSFGGVRLTAEDIASLQLAKSAVCAGILTLCDYTDMCTEELAHMEMVGSFGNHIDPMNAGYIGLIPRSLGRIARPSLVGAIDGATMLLFDDEAKKRSEELAGQIETVELADSEFFQNAFIDGLYFR